MRMNCNACFLRSFFTIFQIRKGLEKVSELRKGKMKKNRMKEIFQVIKKFMAKLVELKYNCRIPWCNHGGNFSC